MSVENLPFSPWSDTPRTMARPTDETNGGAGEPLAVAWPLQATPLGFFPSGFLFGDFFSPGLFAPRVAGFFRPTLFATGFLTRGLAGASLGGVGRASWLSRWVVRVAT